MRTQRERVQRLIATPSLCAVGMLLLICVLTSSVIARRANSDEPAARKLLPSKQRSGDAVKGREYLLSGDYLDAGIPLEVFKAAMLGVSENELSRAGDNAVIPYQYTAVTAPNGAKVVAPNCLQCHASYVNEELILGLGNPRLNFTRERGSVLPMATIMIEARYGADSKEVEAFEPFARAVRATSPNILTTSPVLNPADKIAICLAAHRDSNTLKWQEEANFEVPLQTIATDVPPLWHLKKKNALFYSGVGRGDYARLTMASSLLTLNDKSKAEEVDKRFPDVVAYLSTLEPPAYPYPIDRSLAAKGRHVYGMYCAECHGIYDEGKSHDYPNLLVDVSVVGTDEAVLQAYDNSTVKEFLEWFNNGWFGSGEHAAELVPTNGYVAPPLDGIWVTAPYLHNGSVPSLETLLDSDKRPTYWRFEGVESVLDQIEIGWKYKRLEKSSLQSYDTTKYGASNQGHTFGDDLSADDRHALLEFLKTL